MAKHDPPVLLDGGSADYLCAHLDYEDMVALSGIYRQWAVYGSRFSPEQRTRLMVWSADFEYLAKWVGEGWRASDPSPEMTLLQCLANLVRQHSSVVKLEHAKHWLGRMQRSKRKAHPCKAKQGED